MTWSILEMAKHSVDWSTEMKEGSRANEAYGWDRSQSTKSPGSSEVFLQAFSFKSLEGSSLLPEAGDTRGKAISRRWYSEEVVLQIFCKKNPKTHK